MTERPRFSFVVPIYNEEETLHALYKRLTAVLDRLDGDSEVILVDDGSTDRSLSIARELHERDPRFKVVRLARNFGHQLAITAGLDLAVGDATIVMDADLQDPPEVVPELVARWREGYEVVYAVREDRESDALTKRLLAALFYRVLRRLTDVDIPVNVGDFRLIDRRVLEEFKGMRERNRYVRGMFSWIGFRQTGVPFTRAPRVAGKTKYPFRRSLRLAVDGLISFSNAPLRAALALGFAVSVTSFIIGVLAFVGRITHLYVVVRGYASVVVLLSFLGGIQLIVLGMVGLYVARTYDEVRQRPLYIISEAHGFAAEPESIRQIPELAPVATEPDDRFFPSPGAS
jgi:polyisoprenyl-phosphate glycosyltransferase